MARPSRHQQSIGRALVVGIDQYPYIRANPLHGCVNDARRIADVLEERYFFQEVLCRFDDDATRDALLDAMQQLLDVTEPGERIVVHFSGHGSQIRNADGSLVETLVPHDSGRQQWPNRDITDHELYAWVLRLSAKTPFITLIFDSCHAGGALRNGDSRRSAPRDERIAALRDKQAFLPPTGTVERGVGRTVGLSGWLPSESFVLIAACRPGERARETIDKATGLHHGLLSCALCEELAKPTGRRSHLDLFETVARRVTGECRDQNPQLVGARDREVFGTLSMPVMRFVPVVAREGPRVVLGAGAIHGLVAGSEWQVYPPGTRRRSDARPRGRVRIAEVFAAESSGVLTADGPEEEVAAGDRAVEIVRPRECWRLEIAIGETIDPPARGRLADALDASSWLARVSEPALTIDRIASFGLRAADGSSDESGWSWAAFDRSGHLALPGLPARSTAIERLVADLETLARKTRLAELRHPDANHALSNVLAIELWRRPPGGEWRPAEAGPGAEPVFFEGDALGIRLRHHYESPLYVGILDLGMTASIELLHPIRGAFDPLPPGRELELGLRPGDLVLKPYLPAQAPLSGETSDRGRETLVFLALTEPADFGLWVQRGVRGATGADRGQDARHQRSSPAEPAETRAGHWTVISRSFWIRRSPPGPGAEEQPQ